MESNPVIATFFRPLVQSKTYLNLLYLLLAFPLGVIYFVFLVTSLSVGIALIILWIGLLILAMVFAVSWALTAFERQLAIGMLGENVPPMSQPMPEGLTTWQRLGNFLRNPVTWKGLAFLLLKFPIGLFTFTVVVTLLVSSVALILAPLIYSWANIDLGIFEVDNLSEAILCSLHGILLLPASLHIFNAIAFALGTFARVMLGQPAYQPAIPANSQTASAEHQESEIS